MRRGPRTVGIVRHEEPKNEIGSVGVLLLTVVDSSRNKTCEREHPIENAVCSIYQGGILQATSAEIRNGAEHANSRKTGNPWVHDECRGMTTEERRTYRLGLPVSWGI